jgi:hypothetical protein
MNIDMVEFWSNELKEEQMKICTKEKGGCYGCGLAKVCGVITNLTRSVEEVIKQKQEGDYIANSTT